jgi:hypothetical protein
MDIKQEFREEKNMDVYATNVNDGSFSNIYVKWLEAKLTLTDVGSSLPDLRECNQASFDYATKKDYPDFFLIKQTFKEGINWALNYVTKKN